MSATDPIDGCADAWIWPDDQGVRWWTPFGTTRLDLSTPCPWGSLTALRELRDRRDRLSLQFGLSEPLGHLIAAELAARGRLRLHLSRALDPAWHACPYEWLTLSGLPLFGTLLAERYSPTELQPVPPVDPKRPIVVLNLLAVEEPIQPADALPDGIAQIFDGRPAVDHYLSQGDVSGLGALVVIAHGTECGGEHPFRLADGSTWALPLDRGLPPLVILLACGNDEGNLVIDACRLLDGGAITVLAPLGRPCPDGAGRFLATLLSRWCAGERLDRILLDAQTAPDAARGACLMQLVGRGDLRMSAAARPDELDDQVCASTAKNGDGDALRILIQRLTLRCFQTGQELDQAEAALRALLQVRWYDEPAERRLLMQLEGQSDRLWPLAQAWVRPLEALFAEAYDHGRLPELEQARRLLEGACSVEIPAPIFHYWSKIAYRRGQYALSLKDVARGLSRLRPDAFCTRGAGLVGHLVGLLVDVDLPAPAAILHQKMEDCLAHQSDEKSDWERHKLKDRAARIALRLGQVERATALYRLKRAESGRFGFDGSRELAWLLFIGAWANPTSMAGLAGEAHALITDPAFMGDGPGCGNDNQVYLLRAYAAYAWRAGDEDACRLVLGYRDLLEERLYSGDAGPPGFVFFFLQLCRDAGMPVPAQIPSPEAIAAPMEDRRYFLELAAFSALRGEARRAKVLLERVQAQRTPASPLAFPDWVGEGVLTDWGQLVNERAAYERTILVGESLVTPERLVKSGLLPL